VVEDATAGGAASGAPRGGFVIAPNGGAGTPNGGAGTPNGGAGAPGAGVGGASAASAASGGRGVSTRPGRHSRTGAQPARGVAQPGASDAMPAQPGEPNGPAVPAALAAPGLARPQRRGGLQYTAPSDDASGNTQERAVSSDGPDYSKVGRNAPCPCGSGRKYKLCHGDPRNR